MNSSSGPFLTWCLALTGLTCALAREAWGVPASSFLAFHAGTAGEAGLVFENLHEGELVCLNLQKVREVFCPDQKCERDTNGLTWKYWLKLTTGQEVESQSDFFPSTFKPDGAYGDVPAIAAWVDQLMTRKQYDYWSSTDEYITVNRAKVKFNEEVPDMADASNGHTYGTRLPLTGARLSYTSAEVPAEYLMARGTMIVTVAMDGASLTAFRAGGEAIAGDTLAEIQKNAVFIDGTPPPACPSVVHLIYGDERIPENLFRTIDEKLKQNMPLEAAWREAKKESESATEDSAPAKDSAPVRPGYCKQCKSKLDKKTSGNSEFCSFECLPE